MIKTSAGVNFTLKNDIKLGSDLFKEGQKIRIEAERNISGRLKINYTHLTLLLFCTDTY